GTETQRGHYLPGMATGEVRGALCLTEPGAGSDLQAIATTARAGGSKFIVKGSKFFVTNGARASVLLTLVKTDPAATPAKNGISLLMVDKDAPGVSIGSTFHKMAYGHVDTVEILLNEAIIPESALLGGIAGRG